MVKRTWASFLLLHLLFSKQQIQALTSSGLIFSRNGPRRLYESTMPPDKQQQQQQRKEDSSLSGRTQDKRAAAAVEFARLVGKLKRTPRTGWVRRGVPRYESVADHSWRVAALALVLLDNNDISNDDNTSNTNTNVDVTKCMAMAIVHDLAEAIVGDIAPDDNISKEKKQQLEHDAVQTIVATLQRATSTTTTTTTTTTTGRENDNDSQTQTSLSSSSQLLASLFHEYEQRTSREAIAVKDLDLLDMIVQADEYEELFGIDLEEFFQGTPVTRFQTVSVRRIAEAVHERREQRRADLKETIPDNESLVLLSRQDEAFVEEYAQASKLSRCDIESVVRALRARETSL